MNFYNMYCNWIDYYFCYYSHMRDVKGHKMSISIVNMENNFESASFISFYFYMPLYSSRWTLANLFRALFYSCVTGKGTKCVQQLIDTLCLKCRTSFSLKSVLN